VVLDLWSLQDDWRTHPHRLTDTNVFSATAAGNSGTESYEADFVASSENFDYGDGRLCVLHQFGTSITDTAQYVDAPDGATIVLQWTDPFATVNGSPGAANDFDLWVFDLDGNVLEDLSSAQSNVGGDPVEAVVLPPGQYLLSICADGYNADSSAPPIRLKWINFGFSLNEISPDTQSSTSFGHSNARNVAGVAAANFQNTPRFGQTPPLRESFTSRGGTPILFDENGRKLDAPEMRLQPRFTAVDGTSTTFFGVSDRFFFGTSAAAPNCAAIALLLLQFNPNLSPAEVYAALASTAIDMGVPGFDFDTGAGLVDAQSALSSLMTTATTPTATPTTAPTTTPEPSTIYTYIWDMFF
jgi:Subtilase family